MLTPLSPFPAAAAADPHPGPGQPWTPHLAEDFLRRHDAAVTAAFFRIQNEMAAAHPGGGIYIARYDATGLVRANPTRTALDAQLVAFVQARAASGRIISAAIAVEWDTGRVRVKGWPDRTVPSHPVPGCAVVRRRNRKEV